MAVRFAVIFLAFCFFYAGFPLLQGSFLRFNDRLKLQSESATCLNGPQRLSFLSLDLNSRENPITERRRKNNLSSEEKYRYQKSLFNLQVPYNEFFPRFFPCVIFTRAKVVLPLLRSFRMPVVRPSVRLFESFLTDKHSFIMAHCAIGGGHDRRAQVNKKRGESLCKTPSEQKLTRKKSLRLPFKTCN